MVIGVDMGTQSTKAVLVGRDGTILLRRHGPTRPNWAEQHPNVWVEAVEACLSEVARHLTPSDVRGFESPAFTAAPAFRSMPTSNRWIRA
ncbi:FGGY family carbohydrate kinase [Lichenifustis flavocetrariae]|uniref:FGGY family carbohydrate kinase n=1 Tax=Lichenifustis flavocetrariae TaxID=2949735 RepID=A0AA41Z3C7_9HYPH|nr:FGGY family carbohydrate kinase [Lichenifustis flavocetrariae]MCW6509595.1 FGGY family carbohydrate kinase [Lichenifustis flavocetrariae]